MWGHIAALDKQKLYLNISWLDVHYLIYPQWIQRNWSPFFFPVQSQLILLSCFQLREYWLQLLSYSFSPLFVLSGLVLRAKGESLSYCKHIASQTLDSLSEEKQNKAWSSIHTQREDSAVSVCFVLVAHCHKWTQPHCLVLNPSHKHARTHSQEPETCSPFVLFFSHFSPFLCCCLVHLVSDIQLQ